MDITQILNGVNIKPEEYDFVMSKWREIARFGIHAYPDDVVRSLFINFSEMSSSLQLLLGELTVALKTADWHLEQKFNYLMSVVYDVGAVNKRTAEAKSDARYNESMEEKTQAEADLIICKALISTLDTAANALSRELSYRIKQ